MGLEAEIGCHGAGCRQGFPDRHVEGETEDHAIKFRQPCECRDLLRVADKKSLVDRMVVLARFGALPVD